MLSKPYWLILIVALTAKLLFFFTHQNFSQDVVRDYQFIQQHITDTNWYIPLGPAAASYSNFATPPLYYYLQLVAQLVGRGYFYSMAITIMIIESFTPLLLYFWITKLSTALNQKSKGTVVAFGVAILYSVSPLVLIASTSSWNPNLVPFFSLSFILCSQLFLFEKRNIFFVLASLSFVFLINLHFQFFVLTPLLATIVFVALRRLQQTWKYLLLATALSGILLSPYLIYEMNNQFGNVHNAYTFITGGSDTIAVERIRKPMYVAFYFPGFYMRALTGQLYLEEWHDLYEPDWPVKQNTLAAVVFWAVVGTYAWVTYRTYLSNRSKARWLLFPIALFGTMAIVLRAYKGDKPDYFLYAFLPIFFIFLGGALLGCKNTGIRYGLLAIFLANAVYGVVSQPTYNEYADWQEFVKTASAFPKDELQITPVNHNLVTGLRYFFSDQQLGKEVNPGKKYNILVCEAWQNCSTFQANVDSDKNYYKYDLVNPENYSTVLPSYSATASSELITHSLHAKIIVQE